MSDKTTLLDISVVEEISSDGSYIDLHKVNLYLQAGWVLLNTYPVGGAREGQILRYALGWRRSQGDPVWPERS